MTPTWQVEKSSPGPSGQQAGLRFTESYVHFYTLRFKVKPHLKIETATPTEPIRNPDEGRPSVPCTNHQWIQVQWEEGNSNVDSVLTCALIQAKQNTYFWFHIKQSWRDHSASCCEAFFFFLIILQLSGISDLFIYPLSNATTQCQKRKLAD